MTLDTIIYDTNTLSSALTENLLQDSPTFTAMYPSETATSLVTTMAGYGSMLQYTLASALANCYADSAFSPSGIYQIAETLGNKLHGNIASKMTCTLERTTCRGSRIIVPAYSIFEVEGLQFFNPEPIAFGTTYNLVSDVLLVQGVVTSVSKQTTGVADEKIYFSSNFKADPDYIKVYVNGEEWSITDSFLSIDSYSVLNSSELKTVVVRTDSDGKSYVKLGNGVNGLLPASGSTVKIQFIDNLGIDGNILKNNLSVTLKSPIYYDNTQLEVEALTTSTAYGGAATQSLATLKESSPYVFASGDRCIRRQDYKSMLLNKCGYSSVNVWGEYEEALLKGTYDKIMMNMVYYTGIKDVQQYEYSIKGYVTDIKEFDNTLGTSRAFPGSVSIKVGDPDLPEDYIIYNDTTGSGLLFNDSNDQFSIDDFSQDYISGVGKISLIAGGTSSQNSIYNTVYTGSETYLNSHYESEFEPTLLNPVQIQYTFSSVRALAGIKFYVPTGDINYLKNGPRTIAIYGTDEEIPAIEDCTDEEKVKYYNNVRNNKYWSEVLPFTYLTLGSTGSWSNWLGTNLRDYTSTRKIVVNNTTYVRNSTKDTENAYGWVTTDTATAVYVFTKSGYPVVGDNAYATSEVKTSCGLITSVVNTQWRSFKRYLLEIYSLQDGSSSTLKLGKVKLLYNEVVRQGETEAVSEVGTIDYDNNGEFHLNFTDMELFNKLYQYVPTVKNISLDNGYAVGDTLTATYTVPSAYKYFGGYDSVGEKIEAPVILNSGQNYRINDIVYIYKDPTDPVHSAYLKYKVSEVDSDGKVLAGYLMDSEGSEEFNGSYDTLLYSEDSYSVKFTTTPSTANITLTQDEVTFGTDLKLKIQSEAITLTFTVYVLQVMAVRDETNNNDFTYSLVLGDETTFYGKYIIDSTEHSLLEVDPEATGTGAVISFVSRPALAVQATYYGNKISEDEITSVDEVIINKYNHFTTYIEYVQPQVVQTHITARIKYRENVDSVAVRQNINTAVQQLFDISPTYLGQSLKLSEIYNAIRDTTGVDYCIIDYPATNVDIDPNQFIVLSELELIDEA